jgi:hypothetical protein
MKLSSSEQLKVLNTEDATGPEHVHNQRIFTHCTGL